MRAGSRPSPQRKTRPSRVMKRDRWDQRLYFCTFVLFHGFFFRFWEIVQSFVRRGAPGRKSVTVVWSMWRKTALSLLKTSCRSWYLLGTFVRCISSRGSGVIGLFSGTAESRHCAWQYLLQPRMEAVDQYMCGLCNLSQPMPRTMGDNEDEMRNSSMNYMNNTVNFMGSILCVSTSSRLPFMANIFLWTDSSTSGWSWSLTQFELVKSSSAPESTNTWTRIVSCD